MPTNTTTANLYVTLPNDDHGTPTIHTSNASHAPAADTITPEAANRIAIAANRIDEDNCADCTNPIGYRFDGRTDPETFINTGFFVTSDGRALCEDCGE